MLPLPTDPDTLTACGITWDAYDIARFLRLCAEDSSGCLVWMGAKSRGRGNTAWYGSFTVKGKTVRAHKFYAVAVLGQRPQTGIHHLDHDCCNSLCVRHVECVPAMVNLKLRWIRVQVGIDEDIDRDELVRNRMQNWLCEVGASRFHPEDAERLAQRWQLPEHKFRPDPFDPRYW